MNKATIKTQVFTDSLMSPPLLPNQKEEMGMYLFTCTQIRAMYNRDNKREVETLN